MINLFAEQYIPGGAAEAKNRNDFAMSIQE
jgi:hypothetical protein